jgi:hypothetical protein
MSEITWAVVDAVTWRRVASSSWLSHERACDAIAEWHERQAKGKRPDLDLSGMVLVAVPDELLRRAEQGVIAAKDYKSVQQRTFELSERIQQVEAKAAPLRDLLRRVAVHCIPKFYEMPDHTFMESVWQEVREATR